MDYSNCSMNIGYTRLGYNIPSMNVALNWDELASQMVILKDVVRLGKYITNVPMKGKLIEPKNESSIGKRLDDGSYTGVFGLLQRGEIEMSLIPTQLTQENPIWNYALPFSHEEICLVSSINEPKIFPLDLFYSLRTFDAVVWTLMAIFLAVYLSIRLLYSNLRWREALNTLLEAISVMTKRHIVDANNRTPRRILAVFLLFFTFLWMFFDAGMVNNLVGERSSFVVDTLDDFFTPQGMKYKPVWFNALDMHAEYANSPIGSKKRAIWQRALDNNLDGNLIEEENFGTLEDFVENSPRFKDTVIFDLREMAQFGKRFMCDKFDKIEHISKNSLGWIPIGLMFRLKNDSCTQYKKKLIFKHYEKFLEQGYIPYAKRAMRTTMINEQTHWQCLKPEKEFPYHKQNQVGISNIKLSLQLLSISYLIILIVFILELLTECF